jgi:hypothetical protein
MIILIHLACTTMSVVESLKICDIFFLCTKHCESTVGCEFVRFATHIGLQKHEQEVPCIHAWSYSSIVDQNRNAS